jgi:SAM-dependent methyltransferase
MPMSFQVAKSEKIRSILKKGRKFSMQNRAFCFITGDRMPGGTAGEGLLGRVQDWVKKYGRIYYLIVYIFAPAIPSFAQRSRMADLLCANGPDKVVLNLGSGPSQIRRREDIINVDIFAFDQVDMVADATDLPIEDNSVDLILNAAMLEHVDDPQKVVSEMQRILRPGGSFYCYLPFMTPFHAAPHDFYRWTIPGGAKLFFAYENLEIGIGAGPMCGLVYVGLEWLSILFSFGSRKIHDLVFMLLLIPAAPFKLLDFILVHFPYAERISGGFYVVGTKGR